jgi:hypothetical protein
MGHEAYDSGELQLATGSDQERRRDQRLEGQLTLTFSGMDGDHMVIDLGTVTNLCQNGIGVRAERPLKSDMELALFINCLNSDDHVCIPEARVAWVSEEGFGISTRSMKSEDQERLRSMLLSTHRHS